MRESKKGKYPIDSGLPDLRGRAGRLGPNRVFISERTVQQERRKKAKKKHTKFYGRILSPVCGVLRGESGTTSLERSVLRLASLKYSSRPPARPRFVH